MPKEDLFDDRKAELGNLAGIGAAFLGIAAVVLPLIAVIICLSLIKKHEGLQLQLMREELDSIHLEISHRDSAEIESVNNIKNQMLKEKNKEENDYW